MNIAVNETTLDEINRSLGFVSSMDFFEAQLNDRNCVSFYPNNQHNFASTSTHPQHEGISHDRYIAVSVVEVIDLYSEYVLFRFERNFATVGRVTLVDYRGDAILDTYVYLTNAVEDYRTQKNDFNCPQSFDDVQQLVAALIHNKILVGHRIWKFLSAMGLSHRALDTRDFALYRPFRKKIKSRLVVDLQTLVQLFLGRDVLGVDSVETSRAAMDLFRFSKEVFEKVVASGGWPCDLPPSAFAAHYS